MRKIFLFFFFLISSFFWTGFSNLSAFTGGFLLDTYYDIGYCANGSTLRYFGWTSYYSCPYNSSSQLLPSSSGSSVNLVFSGAISDSTPLVLEFHQVNFSSFQFVHFNKTDLITINDMGTYLNIMKNGVSQFNVSYYNFYIGVNISGNYTPLQFSFNSPPPPANQKCYTKDLNFQYADGFLFDNYNVATMSSGTTLGDTYPYVEDDSYGYTVYFTNLELSGQTDYGSNLGNIQNINTASGLILSTFGSISSPIDYTSFQGIQLEYPTGIEYFRIDSPHDFYFYLYDDNAKKISNKKYYTNEIYYFETSKPNILILGFETGFFQKDYVIDDISFGPLGTQIEEAEICEVENEDGTKSFTLFGEDTTQDRINELQQTKPLEDDPLGVESSSDFITIIKDRLRIYSNIFSIGFNKNYREIPLYLPTGSTSLQLNQFVVEIPDEGYSPENVVVLGSTTENFDREFSLLKYIVLSLLLIFYMTVVWGIVRFVIFGLILFLIGKFFEFVQMISFTFLGGVYEDGSTGNLLTFGMMSGVFIALVTLLDTILGSYFDAFAIIISSLRNILGNFINFGFTTFFDSNLFYGTLNVIDIALQPILIGLFIFLATKKFGKLL